MIHNMAILFDLTHKYDPHEFEGKNADDIEIVNEKLEDDLNNTLKDVNLDNSLDLGKNISQLSETLQRQASETSSMGSGGLRRTASGRVDPYRNEYSKQLANRNLLYFIKKLSSSNFSKTHGIRSSNYKRLWL
jgi:hypothetical protein